jgi:hypothetical protein
MSFRAAADLDPLGEGAAALVALHDALGDGRGARTTLEREVAQLRQALQEDPLHGARLRRLAELLATLAGRYRDDPSVPPATAADLAGATRAVAAVRGLLSGAPPLADAGPRPLAPHAEKTSAKAPGTGGLWGALPHPGMLGFFGEIWPHLHESAAALFPSPAGAPAHGPRIAAGADPRAAWIEASAAGCGLPGLRLFHAPASAPAGLVAATLDPEPALTLGPEALEGGAEARFRVGRALSLLRDRATALEWVGARELGVLYACAAATVAASPPAGAASLPEATLKTVARVMSRRDRKALALQTSRFAFESPDLARWQHAVLRTADRLGLLLAGDIAVGARVAAGGEGGAVTPEALHASARALDLLRFALSESYPVLRREAGLVP